MNILDMRNKFLSGIAISLISIGGYFTNTVHANSAPSTREADRPNVVVIVADDLGYADVGFSGARDIRTPNLDALATGGIVASSGYVSASICSPSRAGLMTGRYQERFGHENNLPPGRTDREAGLPLTETTFAEVMKGAGYVTGAIGKWHLGANPVFHPNNRGFDEFFGFIGGQHDYLPGGSGGDPIQRNGVPVNERSYLTTAFGREAADFIDRHHEQPFFLYLAFNAPHVPLQAPQEYLARYSGIENPTRRTYAAMVSALDDAVGVVARALAIHGLDRRTLVVFLSDNGGQKGNGGSNEPLRGGKASLFEGGIRVPFFLRMPGTLPSGQTYQPPISALDILPTAAALAGTGPSGKRLDGVNLLPFLKGSANGHPHEALFWRLKGGVTTAVRAESWKAVTRGDEPMVFNLAADGSEERNLLEGQPLVARQLTSLLAAWKTELVPPLW